MRTDITADELKENVKTFMDKNGVDFENVTEMLVQYLVDLRLISSPLIAGNKKFFKTVINTCTDHYVKIAAEKGICKNYLKRLVEEIKAMANALEQGDKFAESYFDMLLDKCFSLREIDYRLYKIERMMKRSIDDENL